MMQYEIQKKSIVYLDESGFSMDAPRMYGYAEKGKRCYGIRDWHSRGRLNAIGALLTGALLTVCLFDANINSDIFYVWLLQDLLPKLPPRSVLVLDNASFHKREDMKRLVQNAGHKLEYLPPYSPDLNPIEHKWAQAKALRRKLHCDPFQLFLHPSL